MGRAKSSDRIPSRNKQGSGLALASARRRALRVGLALAMPFAIFFGGLAYTLLRRRLA